jgi:hypothetical protein
MSLFPAPDLVKRIMPAVEDEELGIKPLARSMSDTSSWMRVHNLTTTTCFSCREDILEQARLQLKNTGSSRLQIHQSCLNSTLTTAKQISNR